MLEMNGYTFEAMSAEERNILLIDPSKLNFTGSESFVNRTSRFVLPIPNLGTEAEILTYPEGDIKAGQPMKQNAAGETEYGIIFLNGADGAWQSVRANGREAILINDISKEDAQLLKDKVGELTFSSKVLTLDGIKQILNYACHELGLVDFYDKKIDSVNRDMAPADETNPFYMTVTKSTQHQAIFVAKSFCFDGPVQQRYPDGAVLVTDGERVWGVATEVFLKNFKAIHANTEQALTATDELLQL